MPVAGMSMGDPMGLPMAGTGHPLLTHRVSTAAMEGFGGFLGLCLGGVEGGQRFATLGGLSEGQLGEQEGKEDECSPHQL